MTKILETYRKYYWVKRIKKYIRNEPPWLVLYSNIVFFYLFYYFLGNFWTCFGFVWETFCFFCQFFCAFWAVLTLDSDSWGNSVSNEPIFVPNEPNLGQNPNFARLLYATQSSLPTASKGFCRYQCGFWFVHGAFFVLARSISVVLHP